MRVAHCQMQFHLGSFVTFAAPPRMAAGPLHAFRGTALPCRNRNRPETSHWINRKLPIHRTAVLAAAMQDAAAAAAQSVMTDTDLHAYVVGNNLSATLVKHCKSIADSDVIKSLVVLADTQPVLAIVRGEYVSAYQNTFRFAFVV